jgi:predicted Zn-dependent peptidase/outer membrane lipoprotein-sorting protein
MKTRLLVFGLLVLLSAGAFAQKKTSDKKAKPVPAAADAAPAPAAKAAPDFRKKPGVGEMREIEFPRYSEATLSNGLKVYVVEDHKQPTIAYRIQIGAGESLDGATPGLSYMMTNLIYKGTQKRTAAELSNSVDSVGANLSTNSQGELMTISLDGLKKHNALLLNIFADVIQNPLFPKEELDKLIPQVMASIKQERANPMALAGALSRIALYGKDHPSALRRTEQSVKSISIADIRAFHEKYVRPNNRACLTVVGDVSMNEILPQLEKAFANWKPNQLTITQMPAPKPMPRGVYFIQRPGSVQSSLVSCALVPGRKDEMYEPFSLATSVLGSGFAGRLFKTLRETYSFTYTPYAAVTQGKYFNRFFAGADVRNAVTDSAIMVLKREINKIATDVVPDDEFNALRMNELGNYLMTFERSDFVAGLLQNAEYLGMSPEYLKGYAKRLAAYSPYDAQRAASQYMRDDKQYLIVVGSPDIAPILAKYGRVFTYDLDLNPVGDNMEKVNLTVDELMKAVQKAMGGKEKMDAIQTMHVSVKTKISAGGREFDGSSDRKMKAPNKKVTTLTTPFGSQEIVVNGTNGWVSMMGQPAEEMDEKTRTSAIAEAGMFYYTQLPALGYTCEIKGKQNGLIHLHTTSPSKQTVDFYFDAATYLLRKVEQTQDSPQGPMTITESYDNFVDVAGVKLPSVEKLEMQGMGFTSTSTYEINTPMEDSLFERSK